MSDWDKDPHEGTMWAKDPHRGTVWSNNPHEGTIWDNRNDVRQQKQTTTANETRTHEIEEALLGRGRSGFGFGGTIFFLVLFNAVVTFAYTVITDLVNANTARNETLRYHLLNWLSHTFYIFLPVSTLILFINLLLRRYWSGAMLVIATGIVILIGTAIYQLFS